MPRSADSERPKILQKVRAYLEQAAVEPSLGLTHDEIASGARVAKRHFSRTDHPEFVALAQEIGAAQQARAPQVSPIAETPPPFAAQKDTGGAAEGVGAPSGEGLEGLPVLELEVRIDRQSAEVRRIMQVYLGHHRAGEAVTDAPLLLHDLEKAIVALRIQAERIRPIVSEIQRRERLSVPRAAGGLAAFGDRQVGLFDGPAGPDE